MSDIQSFVCQNAQRLDVFLASTIEQTRSQVVQLIKKECVYLDGKIISRAGVKLKIGQEVKVQFPEAKIAKALEIDFDVEVLYEDDDVLVINKPTNLTVHPAPSVKDATLVEWLKHKNIRLSTISGEERHGIVHRLDKGTSGVMVVAKNNAAHQFLSEQLQDKSMGRYYLAVVVPPLKEDITIVEKPIKRSSKNRLKMGCENGGKSAKTAFSFLALSEDETMQLIACKLFTGRTHQIRVHLETMSRHILGDHLYGNTQKDDKSERILLHAYEIHFIHPSTKKLCSFVAPMDKYMTSFIDNKFNMESIDEVINPSYISKSFAHTNL